MRRVWRRLLFVSFTVLGLGCGGDETSATGPGASTGGARPAGSGGGSSAAGSGQGGTAGGTASGGSAGAGGTIAGSQGGAGAGGTSAGTSGAGGAGGAGGATGGSAGAGGAAADAGADRTDGAADAAEVSVTRDAGDAGADAATDVSSSDANVAYNPCPPRGMPCVIMPVGDSITQGAPAPAAGGYRVPLFQLARNNMQSITFVGSLADGPAMVDGVPFPRAHEGHSGYVIETNATRMGIAQYFPAAITRDKPNVVLLMIGTNDVDTGVTMIPTRLAALMDTILGADPKLLLVVAQIVPQRKANPDTLNMQVQAYNAAIAPLVKARADAGKHVVMVDMYGAFVSNPNYSTVLLADRLHPTPMGFAVMASTWYAAIRSLLR